MSKTPPESSGAGPTSAAMPTDKPSEDPPGKAIHEGSQIRKIAGLAPWYFLSSLLAKALGLFLLPIYTHYLTPEDYGKLATLQSFAQVAILILSLYMDSAFIRYYYRERSVSHERVKRLYSTYFWFMIAWGCVSAVALVLLGTIAMDSLFDISALVMVVLVVTQLLNQLSLMVIAVWRAELLVKRVAALALAASITTAMLTLLLLIPNDMGWGNMGWQSQIYAAAVAAALQSVILIAIAVRAGWIGMTFDVSLLREGARYAVPLLPGIAAVWIAGYSDRVILTYFGRVADTGLYSVAFQLSAVIYLLHDAVAKVQGPISMSGFTSDPARARQQVIEFLELEVIVMLMVYMALAMFAFEILYVFTSTQYVASFTLLAILGFAYIQGGVYRVFSNIIAFHEKTWVVSAAAIIQAIFNVVLNIIFVPRYGMYAAAISTAISVAIYTLFLGFWSQRLEPIELPTTKLLVLSAVALTTANIVVWNFNSDAMFSLPAFLTKAGILACYVVFCLMCSARLRQLIGNAWRIARKRIAT